MGRSHVSSVFFLFVIFFTLSTLCAQDRPDSTPGKHQGTAPRASAAKCRAQAEAEGLRLGAELLSKKDAATAFAADINRCCLVVEVAVFPKKDEAVDLARFDFTLVEVGTDKPVRPESPTTVAAKLENKKNPPGGVDVATSAGVGYESGTYTDPVTGQPVHVHGVSTSTGVGVSTGNSAPPDVAARDREIIERELAEKSLPEAKVSVPVSGYLYFAVSKPKKDAKYRLVYSGLTEPLTLQLP